MGRRAESRQSPSRNVEQPCKGHACEAVGGVVGTLTPHGPTLPQDGVARHYIASFDVAHSVGHALEEEITKARGSRSGERGGESVEAGGLVSLHGGVVIA